MTPLQKCWVSDERRDGRIDLVESHQHHSEYLSPMPMLNQRSAVSGSKRGSLCKRCIFAWLRNRPACIFLLLCPTCGHRRTHIDTQTHAHRDVRTNISIHIHTPEACADAHKHARMHAKICTCTNEFAHSEVDRIKKSTTPKGSCQHKTCHCCWIHADNDENRSHQHEQDKRLIKN